MTFYMLKTRIKHVKFTAFMLMKGVSIKCMYNAIKICHVCILYEYINVVKIC